MCIQLEPVNGSFELREVELRNLKLTYSRPGPVQKILTIGAQLDRDTDRNGVQEITACFSKEDVRQLFSTATGRESVLAILHGDVPSASAAYFDAPVQLEIVGVDDSVQPSVRLEGTVPARPLDCPSSYISFDDRYSYSTVVRRDTVISLTGSYHRTGYDQAAGTMYSLSSSWDNVLGISEEAFDQFTVSGGIPGSVIPLRARLRFSGQILLGCNTTVGVCGSACLNVRIEESGTSNQSSAIICQGSVDDAVEITIQATVGRPFGLGTFAHTDAAGCDCERLTGYANVTTQLEFRDVTGGLAVTSCQGFNTVTTSATRITWGGLKSRYR